MSKTRLRPGLPADTGALATILGDWVREMSWMPVLHSREEDHTFIAGLISGGSVVTALRGDKVAGFMALEDGWISAFYLEPDARGLGIGSDLLAHAKSRTDKLSLWTFEANSGARRFYARAGFRETDWTDGSGNDEKLPDIRLDWERTAE